MDVEPGVVDSSIQEWRPLGIAQGATRLDVLHDGERIQVTDECRRRRAPIERL